jgi:hypothetical protein
MAQRGIDRLRLLGIERAANVNSSPTRLAFTIISGYLAFELGTLRIWDMLTRRERECSFLNADPRGGLFVS